MTAEQEQDEQMEELDPSVLPGTGTDESEPEWGTTMTVGDTVYATSLFWQPLQDPEDPMPEIRETAESVLDNADLYCIRDGASPQYGLGNAREGHQPGQSVAAVAFADAASDTSSNVAVFEVPEGWWFIAIRNDLILSEEDVLYLREEDAKRAFFSMMAVPDWGRKIAPKSWQIDGANEAKIEDFLSGGSSVSLQRLRGQKNPKTLAMIGGGVVLALFVIYKIISAFMYKPAPLRPPPPIPKMQVASKKTAEPVEIPKPWETLVSPLEFVNACEDKVVEAQEYVIPAWKYSAFSCTSSSLSVEFKAQEGGRLQILKRSFEVYGLTKYSPFIAGDTKTALLTIPFGNLKKINSPPTLSGKELTQELFDIFSVLHTPIVVRVSNLGGFNAVVFTFSLDFTPKMLITLFDKFYGLEITSILFNPETALWTYEGRIYERR